jgi:YHS domain-containing protein
MKKTIAAALLAVSLGAGALWAADPPSTQQAKKPVNKMCAVTPSHEVDPKVTTEHDGKVVGFCCADCIPTFKKDPAKYMKDLK